MNHKYAALIAFSMLMGALPIRAADPHWQEGQQLVAVITSDWNATSGELHRYVREGDAWKAIDNAIPVSVGRSGSAWGLGLHPTQSGLQKREGDGRAPAGLFAIGKAFGYVEKVTTGLDYQPMSAGDYCIDVPASPLYNQIVDVATVGEAAIEGNTEPMRRDLQPNGDDLYQLGFVINHNVSGETDAGSCIFAHVWRKAGSPTAGCTAMDADAMRALLAWLDESHDPRFVLLPRASYGELTEAWQLPALQ